MAFNQISFHSIYFNAFVVSSGHYKVVSTGVFLSFFHFHSMEYVSKLSANEVIDKILQMKTECYNSLNSLGIHATLIHDKLLRALPLVQLSINSKLDY